MVIRFVRPRKPRPHSDIGRDRNLSVDMYRGAIGAEIKARLAAHAALLRRWLEALQRRAQQSD
jgi:hypothetical protein